MPIDPVNAMPSATPNDGEIAAWDHLSREEQLRRYRQALTHPDRCMASDDTMGDILASAKERVAARHHG